MLDEKTSKRDSAQTLLAVGNRIEHGDGWLGISIAGTTVRLKHPLNGSGNIVPESDFDELRLARFVDELEKL